MTRVVNVRGMTADQLAGVVYVGRANPTYNLPAHPLANPFKLSRTATPEERWECGARYRRWLTSSPARVALAKSLRGKVLGCWCAPAPCHADLIADLADGVLMPAPDPDPLFPVPILVDTREQLPFSFAAVPADAGQGGGVWRVATARIGLPSGDYSLDGYADAVAVERKSAADLLGTITRGRTRFEKELARLNAMEFAAVVVEEDWGMLLAAAQRKWATDPHPVDLANVRTAFRSVLAWQQRFPRVHWWLCPGRDFAETTTFRIFERFLKEKGVLK